MKRSSAGSVEVLDRLRRAPRDLQCEPPYPGIITCCFSIRFPDFTIHEKTRRCQKDYPHLIKECVEWNEDEEDVRVL